MILWTVDDDVLVLWQFVEALLDIGKPFSNFPSNLYDTFLFIITNLLFPKTLLVNYLFFNGTFLQFKHDVFLMFYS